MTDYSINRGGRDYLRGSVCLPLQDESGQAIEKELFVEQVYWEDSYNIYYLVCENTGEGKAASRLLRQFFPDPVSCEIIGKMQGYRLEIEGYPYSEKACFFREAYEEDLNRQLEYRELELPSILPVSGFFIRGNTGYILYDIDGLKPLDYPEDMPWDKRGFQLLIQLCGIIARLHEAGYCLGMPEKRFMFTDSQDRLHLIDWHSLERKECFRTVRQKVERGDFSRLPPEIASAGKAYREADYFLDDSMDLFFFGCLLYEAMTGRGPDNLREDLAGDFSEVREVFLNDKRVGVPFEKRKALLSYLKCHLSSLDQRYRDAGRSGEDLREIVDQLQN